jgi:iduronate 2-sulfatase
MKRLRILFAAPILLALGLNQATAAEAAPNVLFLAVDDMNDWIGCLETTPRAITPNLDRLAARGVNFTNAHTAGVFCAPSRAAIFSGQYASTTGCYQTANYFVDHPEIEPLQVSFAKADDLDDLPPKIRQIKTARSRIHQKLEELQAVDDAIHGYLACISYADAMMGRVLDALESSPYADNTIVVLWSDHGYHHGEKGDWGKHTLWERTSNVPFLWAGPGIASGQKSDVTVSLIDIYPTLLDLCGLPQPRQKLEGESLAKTLAEPRSARDRNVFLPHMNRGEYAIINRDWRYIRYGEDGEELYDLQDDPHEWHNLAGEPEHAAKMSELRQFAPTTFAEPAPSLNARKDLVVQGETFRWEKGQGNYTPSPKYLPYTEAAVSEEPTTAAESPTRKRNVLFIVCDDLNTHVSPSGYAPIHTPTLAELASESMIFRRAYCQYPVCGPSRASFLSGLYPQSTGVLDNTADIRVERPDTVTMPQWFKQHGYWTASVGKVFHSPRHEHGELAWNEFLRFDNDELPVVREAREKFEAEHGSIESGPNRRPWRELKQQVSAKLDAQTPPGYGRSGLADDQHKDGKNARQVAEWLVDRAHGDKPFFIACGIQKPHVPFLAPDKYFDLYPQDEIVFEPDRPDLWDSLPKTAISKRYEAFGFELGKEDPPLRREYMQAYHACVSFIDAQLKIVFDALKENGHWDDTIIVFTSDHGYHLGDHFLWGKVTLFDIGARVPFVVRAPGLTKGGTTSEAMVELIDVYPTVADLAGLPAPEHLQGVSLRPVLENPEQPGEKKYAYSIVTRGTQLGYALRNQQWRYGKWPDGEELYDLTSDPDEKHNLAARPDVAERLEELRELLAEKQRVAAARR